MQILPGETSRPSDHLFDFPRHRHSALVRSQVREARRGPSRAAPSSPGKKRQARQEAPGASECDQYAGNGKYSFNSTY
ncbi:hypothetical protein HMPREF0185_03552 [Brevundimonas diminuta 470-4]|nr:hypothetical protein HMPREF0185_03552 [Brevundimonas diminuta 470-4]